MEIVGERNAQRPSRAGSSYMFIVCTFLYIRSYLYIPSTCMPIVICSYVPVQYNT